MAKVLVLYYSSYGHTETMAKAVAAGAREVAGVEATVMRVQETAPEEVAREAGFKLDQEAPIAKPADLEGYDAIVIGSPTRYGSACSQIQSFLDQTGGLWASDKLVGKAGGAFTSTASQHGGQESTLLGLHKTLLHLGMVVVGLPYSFKGQMALDEVTGGSPYGASTIAAGDGSRQPSANELDGARFQGRHIAGVATKLAA